MSFAVPQSKPFGIQDGLSASTGNPGSGKILNPIGHLPSTSSYSGRPGKSNLNFGFNVSVNPKFEFTLNAKPPGSVAEGNGQNGGSDNSNGGGRKNGRPRNGRRGKDKDTSPSFPMEERGSLPVDWNSGISSGLLHNNVQSGESDYSTLYVGHGSLFPGNSKGDKTETFVSGFLDNELHQFYKNTVASNNTISSSRYFIKKDFLGYLKLLIDAVQVYYSIDSVLTLYSNEKLENTGIQMLRMRIDEHVASSFMKLQFELKRHCLPPRMLDFIRMLYQGYTPSLEKNAPIYKLSFKSLWLEAEDDSCIEGSLESNLVDDLIIKLNDAKFSDLRTIYVEAIPSHIIKLQPSYNVPIMSSNFLTFWHNQTVIYSQPGVAEPKVISTCNVKDSQTSFKFFTHQDEYDASFLALKTIYKDHKYSTGLWRPISNFHNVSPTNYISVSRLDEGSLVNNISDALTSACGIAKIPVYNDLNQEFDDTVRPGAGYRKTMYCTEELVELAAQATTRYLFNMDIGKVNMKEETVS